MKRNPTEVEAPVEALIAAIRNLHGCEAMWLESIPVKETFQGQTVWEGEVQVFELDGHPTASRCYAWSYVSDEKTGKRKFYAVLHQGPVDSSGAAVRAAIVTEYRKGKTRKKEDYCQLSVILSSFLRQPSTNAGYRR